jgi:DNA modification methylase
MPDNNEENLSVIKNFGEQKVEYYIKDMTEWDDAEADLVIVDPPFGIEFSGTESNYNRDESNVVEGYVEWDKSKYETKIDELLDSIHTNLEEDGQALIFSGWNNSHIIHERIKESDMQVEGKLYWSYNFAPYCRVRPAHNVYEIYWCVKGDDWTYTNECSFDHCEDGEANLSHIPVKRDYHKDMPKYPTRLPKKIVQILVEHFSEEDDTVFDPCAGSGMVGIGAAELNRNAKLGDLNKEGIEVFDEIAKIESGNSQEYEDKSIEDYSND